MSACARRRWGPGTTCVRPTDTMKTKEVNDKLTEMMAERTRQDARWKPAAESVTKNTTPSK